jgi:hypothetical protein
MPGFAMEGENGVIEQHNIKAFQKFLTACLPKNGEQRVQDTLETNVFDDGGGHRSHS